MREGWAKKKLGDIASVEYGFTAKSKPEGQYRYVRITDIDKNGNLIKESKMFIDSSGDAEQFILNDNDLLMARTGATFAKVLLYKDYEPSVFASYLIKIKFSEAIENKLYWYFSKSLDYWEQANELSSGAAQPHFNGKAVKQVTFSYPVSVNEQKKVVEVLDQAFAAIDQAKANIEKNLQNAKDLFQSKLNETFTRKGEGWEDKTLGDTCIVERGSSPRPIKKYQTESADGVNWVKIGDTKGVEKHIYSTKEKITKEGALKSRFVDIGDFILSNSMSFGRPYIMKTQGYIHDGWFVLRLPEGINTEFFWYLLASPYTKSQFESLAAGAIVKNISGNLVKKAILPIPPLVEQEKIVDQMDLLSSTAKKIETKYLKELDSLAELKKSILQKAFAGGLT